MEIIQKLNLIMTEVGAVGKDERNQHQGFSFRGIDSVVNAVSPVLRKHGVVVVPNVIENHYQVIEVGAKRTAQSHARLVVAYTFYASDGSNIKAVVASEAMDSGDKATAKAMSVAFRIALLQALSLPTDEPDPDSDSYERSPIIQMARPEQVKKFIAACADSNLDHEVVADRAGVDLSNVSTDDLRTLRSVFDEMKAN